MCVGHTGNVFPMCGPHVKCISCVANAFFTHTANVPWLACMLCIVSILHVSVASPEKRMEMSRRTDHRGFPRWSRLPPMIATTPDHRDYPRSSRQLIFLGTFEVCHGVSEDESRMFFFWSAITRDHRDYPRWSRLPPMIAITRDHRGRRLISFLNNV